MTFHGLGDPAGALVYYRKSLEICDRLAKTDLNARAQRDLSIELENLGDVTLKLGDAAGAVDYFRKSLDVREPLARADPKNAEVQSDLSLAFARFGDILLKTDDAAAALDYYRKSLETSEPTADPKNAETQRNLALFYQRLGLVNVKLFNFADATSWYDKLIALAAKLPKSTASTLNESLVDARNMLALCRKANQAAADLSFAVEQPTIEIANLLEVRVRLLAKKGAAADCVATAEAMTNIDKEDGDGLPTSSFTSGCTGSLAFDLLRRL